MNMPFAPFFALFTSLILMIACSAPAAAPTVEGLTIDEGVRAVELGATLHLSVTIAATGDVSNDVTWVSDDTDVATVSATGVVKGVEVGSVLVSATSVADPSRGDSVRITVSRPPGVYGVTINAPITSLAVGSTVDLTASVDTAGGAGQTVIWRSDDANVAHVDATGRVEGVTVGTAVIKATSTANAYHSDTVEIAVEAAPTEPGPPAPTVTPQPMVITTDTTLGHWPSRTARLPLRGVVDVTIDWGDGERTVATSSGDVTHTYASDGRYTIRIAGSLTQFGTGAAHPEQPSAAIISVDAWGDLGLTSLAGALAHTQHLASIPAVLPPTVTDLSHLFHRSEFDKGIAGGWDVSRVTNMSGMFRQSGFNQDIGNWDVSNVTDMSSMFLDARFDRPLGNWDVSSVRTMRNLFGAFDDGSQFNQPIGDWNVSNVTDMSGMFSWSAFDQDIGGWDVSNVTDMSSMFAESDFRRPEIAAWDVSSVTTMSGMFFNTFGFNHDISDWDVSNVTDMSWMFGGTIDAGTGFSQDLDIWDVSRVTNMSGMFANGAFDGDIGRWDVSSVRDMSRMFEGLSGASRFNRDISGWDVSSVADMSAMFNGASEFDQDLSGWCVIGLPAEPPLFAAGAVSWQLPQPRWGTCPDKR